MDTKLVNSQLISRKDVKVWFFLAGREYAGPATMVADNGLVFRVIVAPPRGADPLSWLDGHSSTFPGQKVQAELTSPKVKLEVRLQLEAAGVASVRSGAIAITATFLAPPDPRALKLLLEPVVTRTPKKG